MIENKIIKIKNKQNYDNDDFKKFTNKLKKCDIDDSEENEFLNMIGNIFDKYIKNGERSNKKVEYLHNGIKDMLKKCFPEYDFRTEENIKSINISNKKKIDILGFKNGILIIIFPVKFIMTNYYQNKNNSWENLTGELLHIKKANNDLYIIPINIIFNNIPYCSKSFHISKYELITYEKSYKITEKLKEWKLVSEIINYIIDVEQKCKIGEKYNKCPKIIGFNKNTPYRTFTNILNSIIR
jgi:hypothetical protein